MTTNSPPSDPRDDQWQPAPLAPGGDQMPAAPTRSIRPLAVDVSFWLWISYLTLDVALGGIFILRQGLSVVTHQLAIFVVPLLMDVAMFAFAFVMREGRNWARIVLAVLGGLRLLVLFFVLISGAGGLFAVVWLLVATAIATMFIAGANAWFKPLLVE